MKNNTKYSHPIHLNFIGYYQFITFRTKDSLDPYLKKLYASNETEKIKQYKIDRYLDTSQKGALLYGKLLKEIKNYYLSYDKNIFEVEALSLMPNHIHILLKQNDNLSNIMRILKGGAGYIINKSLNRKGSVWSRDYYDKAIRDEKHFQIVYEYIKNNAIKAGLNDAKERFYGKYE